MRLCAIMSSMKKILLIDDDAKLASLLKEYLVSYGFELISALHPEDGLKLLEKQNPELLILDVMLPGMDGFEVCKLIRKKNISTPIVMLTARGDVEDKIVGLEIGADDYLSKPFAARELVARIQSVLRRVDSELSKKDRLVFKDIEIDLDKRKVYLLGDEIELTTMEYEILSLFASKPGKTFNRDEILNSLHGIDASVYSRSIDISISRLRQKLKDTGKKQKYIKTVWGTGYVFLG